MFKGDLSFEQVDQGGGATADRGHSVGNESGILELLVAATPLRVRAPHRISRVCACVDWSLPEAGPGLWICPRLQDAKGTAQPTGSVHPERLAAKLPTSSGAGEAQRIPFQG